MVYAPRFGPVRPVGPAPVGVGPQLPLAQGLPAARGPINQPGMLSYHKGGKVKKTGPAVLKKGERVLTAQQAKRVRMKAQKILGAK